MSQREFSFELDLLANMPLVYTLPQDALARLVETLVVREFAPQVVIFYEHDPGDHLFHFK